MCSSIAVPMGSRLARIVESASAARCQGFTFWHPAHSASTGITTNQCFLLRFMILFQQLFDFFLVLLFGLSTAETGVEEAHLAVAIQQKRAGHGGDASFFDQLLVGISHDRESGGVFLQKGLHIGPILIDVDSDDHEAPLSVALMQLFHDWKGLLAGLAPGGPKIHENNLAFG